MILIKNIVLITQNKKREIIENGAVVIDGSVIKKIGASGGWKRNTKNKQKK